jgi:hypothetical protein
MIFNEMNKPDKRKGGQSNNKLHFWLSQEEHGTQFVPGKDVSPPSVKVCNHIYRIMKGVGPEKDPSK